MRSIAPASSGTSVDGGAGVSRTCLYAIDTGLLAVNGATPVSISYSTTPSAYTSERPSSAKPCACSGEKYVAVPSTAPVLVSGSLVSARAMPKSVTFT